MGCMRLLTLDGSVVEDPDHGGEQGGFPGRVARAVSSAQFARRERKGRADIWNRAFADFVVCSLILHFFCVNFIN